MSQPSISVIIVSRGRPESLADTLTSLQFQRYSAFEVIVVTDAVPADFLKAPITVDNIKYQYFNEANISAARNAGLKIAAGELVAFIDDDAIPEPKWLTRLAAAFETGDVASAGGFVRGRNGISFQWKAQETNRLGEDRNVVLPDNSVAIRGAKDCWVPKVQGTNCAYRREVLCDLGGFDTAFAFFLDETDLAMRLAERGFKTAIVPLAEVQHGFAASERRAASRSPKDLRQEGFSRAVFLRKHKGAIPADTLPHLCTAQRKRLVNFMVRGDLGPEEVRKLLNGLQEGFQAGSDATLAPPQPIETDSVPFKPFPFTSNGNAIALIAPSLTDESLLAQAKALTDDGSEVMVFCLSPGIRYHRRFFHPCGFWVQTGGRCGKSVRSDAFFTKYTVQDRVMREAALLESQKKFIDVRSV